MSVIDMIVIGAAGFIGWWLVSWLIDRSRKSKSSQSWDPPPPTAAPAPPPVSHPETAGPSVMELSERWSTILGVRPDASTMEIEAAWRAAIERCNRDMIDPDRSTQASARRRQIEAAYEFIRSARKH